ncbi:hypothetical protein [Zhongshania sp.]|uniref:hypothetical protein n=1 Tax=Zhongshania sp. TaxID=1971902 RepID=UPI003569F036
MGLIKPGLLFGMMFSISLMAAEGCSDMGKNTTYSQPDTETLWGAEQLFYTVLRQPLADNWTEKLPASGLVRCDDAPISEIGLDGAKQGWGYYRIATASLSKLIIQAPHQFYDRDTGEIARLLFTEHDFLALGLNSSNRHSDSDVVSADLAHLPRSHFTAMARAAVLAKANIVLVQIHGFAKAKRQAANQRVDLIVSNGTARSTSALHTLSQCAQAHTGLTAAVYPDHIDELGATTNSVGKAMRAMHSRGFLHLELSRNARQLLRDDRNARAQLYECLSSYAR